MARRRRFSLYRFRRLAREFGVVVLLGITIGLGGLTVFETVAAAPSSNSPQKSDQRPSLDSQPERASAARSAFRNCDAARAAGAAPLYEGEPGYGPHLDGDDDGIACEPHRRR